MAVQEDWVFYHETLGQGWGILLLILLLFAIECAVVIAVITYATRAEL